MTKKEKALEIKRKLQEVNASLEDLIVLCDLECGEENTLKEQENFKEGDIDFKIYKLIGYLDVPKNIKGYKYLKEAIKIAYENYQYDIMITYHIYPVIAKKFSVTAAQVERAIRHAIEVSWNIGKVEYQRKIFESCTLGKCKKPSNSQFIMTIAEFLRMEAI